MNWQYILYNVDSGVAHVVLNRPEKLNALGMGPGSNRAASCST
jgi:enoyl-CoA hydratase/carnithine racemase